MHHNYPRPYRDYHCTLFRAVWREGKKTKSQTLCNVTNLSPAAREAARRALNGEELVRLSEAFETTGATAHGHVAVVIALLRKLGLDRMLHSRPSRERSLCIAMIVMRLLESGSKLTTARSLSAAKSKTTLGSLLDLGEVTAEDLYAALDRLQQRRPHIVRALAKRHLQDGTLVLYDVTSTWCEGRKCPLARTGHSREGRKNTMQLVFGLLSAAAGRLVAAEVYPGNTADLATLSDQIANVRKRFDLKRVVFVGDRALLTSTRIDTELRPAAGLDWITALRNGQFRKLVVEGGPLQPSLFDEADLAELRHEGFPGERLIASLNLLLRDERGRKREELLQATEALRDSIVAARRPKRALRGMQRITERATRALDRYRMAKYFDVAIEDNRFAYRRRQEAIAAE